MWRNRAAWDFSKAFCNYFCIFDVIFVIITHKKSFGLQACAGAGPFYALDNFPH